MIEILRETPQSPWTLILFFVILFIYIILYNNDPRRLQYFFLSLYNKQYYVSYGRQSKVSDSFMMLLSGVTFVTASFLLFSYLGYCSNYSSNSFLFFYAALVLFCFLFVKWAAIFLLFFLFKKEQLFQEFIVVSTQYINLFLTPIVFSTAYIYLIGALDIKSISLLILIASTLIIFSKMKLLSHFRKGASLGVSYIILYICTLEIAPIFWLLIGLNC